MRPPAQTEITRDQAEKAAAAIGIPVLDGLDQITVLKAFRFAVRAAHPDTGASHEEAAGLIAAARYHRRTLLRWLSEQPDSSCNQCDGSGWVSAGNGRVRACNNPRCGG